MKHFRYFFFLGLPYLFYKVLVLDSLHILRKINKETPENLDLIFNTVLYRVFK